MKNDVARTDTGNDSRTSGEIISLRPFLEAALCRRPPARELRSQPSADALQETLRTVLMLVRDLPSAWSGPEHVAMSRALAAKLIEAALPPCGRSSALALQVSGPQTDLVG